MALNKFMHPRNIYKKPPDFDKLFKSYPEFSNIAKKDVLGKVSINFKDANSLRILTKCLLKADFNLDVEIPQDRLVPTLPLRLNYILWIEDLLNLIHNENDICGLDIGTGACAIYPLLAAVKNKWHMIGSETDDKSIQIALDNIKRNNLQDLVTIMKNPTSTVVEFVLSQEEEKQFNFCMCNPPFYSSIHELYDSRSPARPEPKNGFTGSQHELITEGGELEFCRKLIKESTKFKNKVKIFTTMVGHKSNLKELTLDLKEEGIDLFTSTEFCQGRVTRWGLAWTFLDYDLYKLLPPREKLRKKPSAMTYILPELPNTSYDLNTIAKKLLSILDDLKISHKLLNKRANTVNIDFISYENTWSNQRRKKRLMKRMEIETSKKVKIEGESSTATVSRCTDEPQTKLDRDTQQSSSADNFQVEKPNTETQKEAVVHAYLKITKKEPDVMLELEFIDGSAGKEGLHQIVQYIKNRWKYLWF